MLNIFSKKRMCVVLFTILLFLASALFVLAEEGCCVSSTSCTVAFQEFDCPNTWQPTPCTDNPFCNIGCCCSDTLEDGEYDMIQNKCNTIFIGQTSVDFRAIGGIYPVFDNQKLLGGYYEYTCNTICSTAAPPISSCVYDSCQQQNAQCICDGVETTVTEKYCLNPSGLNNGQIFITQDECNAAKGESTFVVSGVVYDQNGKVIIGAIIALGQQTTITNNLGEFVFEGVAPQIGDVIAQVTNSVPVSASYDTREGDHSGIEIILNLIAARPEVCQPLSNIEDADADGCVAADDSDCGALETKSGLNACTDGIDNDCDGRFDCYDVECNQHPSCISQATSCGDGFVQSPNSDNIFEECDGQDDSACPGLCLDDCTCPDLTCNNNNVKETNRNEQCDGYDSHCNDPNMVCINCECVELNSCGDNVVQDGEQCDGGVGCIPPGIPGECTYIVQKTCGNGILEAQEECDGALNANCFSASCNMVGNNACTCNYDCSIDPGDLTMTLSFDKANDKISVVWIIPCDGARYTLTKQIGSGNFLPVFAGSLNTSFLDSNFNWNQNYCYNVEAKFSNGIVKSATDCIFIGDEVCYELTDQFCEDNQRYACLNGIKTMVEDCSTTQSYCTKPYDLASTFCAYQSVCDSCNGLGGLFYYFNNPEHRALWAEDPTNEPYLTSCSAITSCYVESTITTVDKYDYCINVDSCYDYESQTACVGESLGDSDSCTNPNDYCGDNCKIGPCEWMPVGESGSSDLGRGVCRPVEQIKQDCTECNYENNPNTIFGSCQRDSCDEYRNDGTNSMCFFVEDDATSYTSYCKNVEDVTCLDYNITQCGEDAEYDVIYDTTATSWTSWRRTTGTNAQNRASTDVMRIGTCIKFDPGDGDDLVCVKDANGDGYSDCSNVISRGISTAECWSDNVPPVTTLDISSDISGNIEIPVGVQDNLANYKTYYCFSTSTCYPDIEVSGGVILDEIDTTGTYNLFYYSEDAARNIEEVQQVTLNVDAQNPVVTIQTIINPKEFDNEYWASNLTIDVSVSENSFCNATLVSVDQALDLEYNDIDLFGDSWQRKYIYLPDGLYDFQINCFDLVGNENEEKSFIILVEGDQSITDLEPGVTFGPSDDLSNIRIAARTQNRADCYASPVQATYSAMQSHGQRIYLSTSDDLHHEAYLDMQNKGDNDNFKYYVACKQLTGDLDEMGNSGDIARFSIDMTPPISSAGYLGNPLDSGWFDSTVDLKFNCYDPKINGTPSEFGGCEMYICQTSLDDGPCIPNLYPTSGGVSIVKSIAEPTRFYYKSMDDGGNVEDIKETTILIDQEPAEVIFEIIDDGDIVDKVSYGSYILKVTSTKPIYSVDSIYYKYSGFTSSINELQEGPTSIDGLTMDSLFILPAFAPEYEGKAKLYFDFVDDHGLTNHVEFEFEVDTKAPKGVILEPALDKYESINYPLIYDANKELYYTRDSKLLITGYTDELNQKISYYLNDFFTPEIVYDQIDNAAIEPFATGVVLTKAEKGSTEVIIQGNFVGFVNSGDYIEFQSHKQSDYNFWKKYYMVQSVVLSGATETRITLQKPIEKLVSRDEIVSFYRKETPADWFGKSLSLDDTQTHTLVIQTEDELGNVAKTDRINLFLDDKVPSVLELSYPQDGFTTPDKFQEINIIVQEFGTELDLDEVMFNINGMSVSYDVNQINCPISAEAICYSFTYQPLIDAFDNGFYDVDFLVKDLAGNVVTDTRSFEVDTDTPPIPVFYLDGLTDANVHPETLRWFTKIKRDAIFTFDDNNQIIIDEVRFYENDDEYVSRDIACVETVTNKFRCSIEGELPDGDYGIKVLAHKDLGDGQLSRQGEWKFYFAVDTLAPEFDYYHDKKTKSATDLSFDTVVYNENHDLKGRLVFNGQEILLERISSVEGLNLIYKVPVAFEWPMGELLGGVYDYSFTLMDYAGNENTKTGQIEIDNIRPELKIENVTARPIILETAEGTYLSSGTILELAGKVLNDEAGIGDVIRICANSSIEVKCLSLCEDIALKKLSSQDTVLKSETIEFNVSNNFIIKDVSYDLKFMSFNELTKRAIIQVNGRSYQISAGQELSINDVLFSIDKINLQSMPQKISISFYDLLFEPTQYCEDNCLCNNQKSFMLRLDIAGTPNKIVENQIQIYAFDDAKNVYHKSIVINSDLIPPGKPDVIISD